MADTYGWPMIGGRCGGNYGDYWTREEYQTGSHYFVYMNTGIADYNYDFNFSQVTCVR
ncbi:hypothetical protein [Aeromonas veronii]|uniref:hypothetical protein n=1 Tax=Aeromonas veronii TaxID=654 RepID=UPI003B9E888A